MYELDLVLRNNITTKENPLGVFHPHSQLHHIKKENIGLIEVMGLAILPGRLKNELLGLETAIKTGKSIRDDEALSKHADWIDELCKKYKNLKYLPDSELSEILRQETGIVFSHVLEDAGVYKRTTEGSAGFARFIDYLNK